jgi:hypothetical protein
VITVALALHCAIEAPGYITGLQAGAYSFTVKRLLEE